MNTWPNLIILSLESAREGPCIINKTCRHMATILRYFNRLPPLKNFIFTCVYMYSWLCQCSESMTLWSIIIMIYVHAVIEHLKLMCGKRCKTHPTRKDYFIFDPKLCVLCFQEERSRMVSVKNFNMRLITENWECLPANYAWLVP